MIVYRISQEKWVRDLSGRGAEIAGGRWNHKGYPAVYTSCSLALCVCEILVHTDSDLPPVNMHRARLDIPDNLINEDLRDFDWTGDSRKIGTEWLKTQDRPALLVPSIVVPSEFNLLLNPRHRDIFRVKLLDSQPFAFDPRFFSEKEPEKPIDLDNILTFLP